MQVAVDYCLEQFSMSDASSSEHHKSYRLHLLNVLEGLAAGRYGRCMLTPGKFGRISIELMIGNEELQPLLSTVDNHIDAYLFFRELGFLCIENGNFDSQPQNFRTWFHRTLSEAVGPPSKAPQRWRIAPRNNLVFNMVSDLEHWGMNATRNEASPPTSACDAVAQAAIQANVAGLKSYESVRKIYASSRRQYMIVRPGAVELVGR